MTTGATIVFTASNSEDLLNYLNTNTVDVLFLDIDLNSTLNGIELAKQIRKTNKFIYIIKDLIENETVQKMKNYKQHYETTCFEHCLTASCKTFDFIHKPFNISALEKTINRLSEDIRNNSTKFLNLNNNKQLVNQTLVNFIEKSGAKTVFNLTTGIVETYGSFNKISLSLPKNFVRCHKSFIVNINNIRNIDFKTDTIFFKTPPNSFCFIGGKYRKNFMEVINNYGNFK